jgi:hypothetical protein
MLQTLRQAGDGDGTAAYGWNRTRPNHVAIAEYAIDAGNQVSVEEVGPLEDAILRDVPAGENPPVTNTDNENDLNEDEDNEELDDE